ncbi:MAG: tetratricopeptide repeat protein [Myxococcales bacterium]|jgi:tetratricopeptide (TPR) repeat protein
MNVAHLFLPGIAALFVLQATNPVADFQKARELASQGDLRGAAALLERSIGSFPDWGLPYVELADVLMRSGGDEARQGKALAEARRLEPQNPRAWVLSARWFERQGETKLAIEACERALALREDLTDTRIQLGLLLVENEPARAIPHLERALTERPDERGVRANLADAYERAGDLEGAERHLRELVRAAPGNAIYARRLARFYERAGRPVEAAAVLREAGDAWPERKMRPLLDSAR